MGISMRFVIQSFVSAFIAMILIWGWKKMLSGRGIPVLSGIAEEV